MTVNRGLWVPIDTGNIGTTDVEGRLADNALVESNDGVNGRTGLLNPQTTTIVTGKANMSYDIAACNPVANRVTGEGVYRFSATGVTNIATTAAPAANSRIDVICLKQNDQLKGDANNLAVAVVIQGAVAASPVAPAIPAGHVELARATVGPNITATTSAAITQTFRYTALKGAPIPVRNVTERGEITAPRQGQLVRRLDLAETPIEEYRGTAWSIPYPLGLLGTDNAGGGSTASAANNPSQFNVDIQANRSIRITATVRGISNFAGAVIAYWVRYGGTTGGVNGSIAGDQFQKFYGQTATSESATVTGTFTNVTAGSIRISLVAQVVTASGTITYSAGGIVMTVEDLGPAS